MSITRGLDAIPAALIEYSRHVIGGPPSKLNERTRAAAIHRQRIASARQQNGPLCVRSESR